jgi:hypothetical protein
VSADEKQKILREVLALHNEWVILLESMVCLALFDHLLKFWTPVSIELVPDQ